MRWAMPSEALIAIKRMISKRLSVRSKKFIKDLLILDVTDTSKCIYRNIFTTPLVVHLLEDGQELNALLRDCILAHEAQSPGLVKSNYGGWHSETGHLEFCGGPGQRLIRHIYAIANEATHRVQLENGHEAEAVNWTIEAWANVNRNGELNYVHLHPGSTWSGTYYVDSGDPIDANKPALLHLIDPCQGRSATFLTGLVQSQCFIKPRPGLVVLFPSYVPHAVLPHHGNRERISIAFNLRRVPFP